MNKEELVSRLQVIAQDEMPLPGSGRTSLRHRRLMEVGREDLSLARLAEAHWDAVAILAEAGIQAKVGILYGVWASERPGQALSIDQQRGRTTISGAKMFCSGAGIVDRALVTTGGSEPMLVDVDLRSNEASIQFDGSGWRTNAFAETSTAAAIFSKTPVTSDDLVGEPGWYLQRPGFWHGACGPAACWAGGAAGLLDYAMQQSRCDTHTLAHLGAMYASVWGLKSYLESAGREIDESVNDKDLAKVRALALRHLVEQACSDVLRRLPRAYGPHPIAMEPDVIRRYQELDLYIRQSHAERDLESLGRVLHAV